MRNTLFGLLVAASLGLSAAGASIWGVAAWKIVAAACGLALIVLGGRGEQRP